MAETYDGKRLSEAQSKDELDQPTGPPLKGLPRDFVEEHPELAWMLDREVSGPNSVEERPIVWVAAEAWEEWREHQDGL